MKSLKQTCALVEEPAAFYEATEKLTFLIL
ncbi:hypothetical protein C8K15_11312 [Paenisporosarcina sp. OV554]|nr:hypothetical protein C8K15_11312 [Paenisporosarcina sp. OV554]